MDVLLSIEMSFSHSTLGAVLRGVSASGTRLLWQALRPRPHGARVRLLAAVTSDTPAEVLAGRLRSLAGVSEVTVVGRGRVDVGALERQLAAADEGAERSPQVRDVEERMVVGE